MPNITTISAKNHDSLKRTMNAPCLVIELDKAGRKVRRVPAVDCEWNCENCGFNPRVKQRRLAKLETCKTNHALRSEGA